MPTFFIRERRTFATFANNHHGDGRVAVWCAAPPGAAETLVASEPEHFITAVLEDAYHTVVTKLRK